MPDISVIVPTYQRRDLVLALLSALSAQEIDGSFEVIVVIDGSRDGTVEALKTYQAGFPLKVIEQPNRGLARTRNRGAEAAKCDILLFLDDDMEPDSSLLHEHLSSHRQGAEAVLGNMPLHPDSPRNLLSEGVRLWAEEMAERLSSPGYRPAYDEIVGGQFSLRRSLFMSLGRFDERFTRAGAYGGEDIEFGHRLLMSGAKIVFNPKAISKQRYVVSPAQQLRQYRQAGHADVAIVRMHPELSDRTFSGKRASSEIHRLVWRVVLLFPQLSGWLNAPLRSIAISRVLNGRRDKWTAWMYYTARAVEYWRGVHEAGGIPRPRPVRVLSYHAVADLSGDAVLEEYGIPPTAFCEQLDWLERAGCHFITPQEFLRFLTGNGGMPRKPILLTFDDCYTDLLEVVAPSLRERAISAVAFAVTNELGGQNRWDQAIGARPLKLLDVEGLTKLSRQGFEIGGHSRSHRALDGLEKTDLASEIAGSIEDLNRIGLSDLRLFAYPYGAYNKRVRQAVRDAGIKAAFTVIPGRVRPGQDPCLIPRIEILRKDGGWRFGIKVTLANRLFLIWDEIIRRVRRSIAGQP